MKTKDFLNCAVRLKRNTGNELGTIGMESETKNMQIVIWGDYSDNYEMYVDASFKDKKQWHRTDLTDSNRKVLEVIFKKEVEKAQEDSKLEYEIQNENEQYANDVERYGRTDTLYNENY